MGHCIHRLQEKSKEKTCIQSGKQTVGKKKIRKLETKDAQKSLLFLFPTHPPLFWRVTVKQIRSSYLNSFPKMGSTEIITQFE